MVITGVYGDTTAGVKVTVSSELHVGSRVYLHGVTPTVVVAKQRDRLVLGGLAADQVGIGNMVTRERWNSEVRKPRATAAAV